MGVQRVDEGVAEAARVNPNAMIAVSTAVFVLMVCLSRKSE